MVGELKIIFGLDTVALHLRVAGETLVFFQQLGGVAALAIILAIASARIHVGGASTPAPTASAAALTIVYQTKILTNGGSTLPSPVHIRPTHCSTHEGTSPPSGPRHLTKSPDKRPSNRGSATSGPHASDAVVGPVPCPYVATSLAKSKHKSIALYQALSTRQRGTPARSARDETRKPAASNRSRSAGAWPAPISRQAAPPRASKAGSCGASRRYWSSPSIPANRASAGSQCATSGASTAAAS